MEEKDVNNIATAVSNALVKLNVDTKAAEEAKEKANKGGVEVLEGFNCPECGSPVKGMTPFCFNCGCPLDWEA